MGNAGTVCMQIQCRAISTSLLWGVFFCPYLTFSATILSDLPFSRCSKFGTTELFCYYFVGFSFFALLQIWSRASCQFFRPLYHGSCRYYLVPNLAQCLSLCLVLILLSPVQFRPTLLPLSLSGKYSFPDTDSQEVFFDTTKRVIQAVNRFSL